MNFGNPAYEQVRKANNASGKDKDEVMRLVLAIVIERIKKEATAKPTAAGAAGAAAADDDGDAGDEEDEDDEAGDGDEATAPVAAPVAAGAGEAVVVAIPKPVCSSW